MNRESRATLRAYIGLGGNLGDPAATLASAVQALGWIAGCQVVACSPLYRSAPLGRADQPDYLNAVVALDTALPALTLLGRLQRIEADHGRVREARQWGPRTLDLDLLLYGDQFVRTPTLTVPHPGLTERAFVLYPLRDIAPHLVLPGGERLADVLRRVPDLGLERLGELDEH